MIYQTGTWALAWDSSHWCPFGHNAYMMYVWKQKLKKHCNIPNGNMLTNGDLNRNACSQQQKQEILFSWWQEICRTASNPQSWAVTWAMAFMFFGECRGSVKGLLTIKDQWHVMISHSLAAGFDSSFTRQDYASGRHLCNQMGLYVGHVTPALFKNVTKSLEIKHAGV